MSRTITHWMAIDCKYFRGKKGSEHTDWRRNTVATVFFSSSVLKALFKENPYSLFLFLFPFPLFRSVVPFMPSKTHASQQQHQQQHHQRPEEVKLCVHDPISYPLFVTRRSLLKSLNSHSTNNSPEDPNSVDIMNLYIKNLEPHITNHDLNQTFRKFGRIISARVMTNPATGQSKGYGFVSFGKSEEAAAALKEMNGVMLGNRPLTVAYHEPRKGRPNTMNYNSNHNNNNDSNVNHHHYQQPQQQQQHQQHGYQQHPYYNSNNNNSGSSNMERSNNCKSPENDDF